MYQKRYLFIKIDMEFSDRIEQYIKHQGVSIRQFEIKIDVKNGTISRAIKNKTSLNGDNMTKIGLACPDLSLDWLLTGRGEMLRSKNEVDLKNAEDWRTKEIDKLEKDLAEWKELVEVLKLAIRDKSKR